ncbi:MAG: methyltransferase domain-containing protein [Oscillospiraceae bacterium]
MNKLKLLQPTLTQAVMQQVELPNRAAILDIGCGTAYWLLSFLQVFGDRIGTLIGIDKKGKGFAEFDTNGTNINMMKIDILDGIAFPDESFDFIFSKDTLECVPDKEKHIREIHRLLKPDGFVICVHCDWDSIAINGSKKEIINKAIHNYANWQQPWMDDLDSWAGRRLYAEFNRSGLFNNHVSVHTVIETEYSGGFSGYSYINDELKCLVTHDTGLLSKSEFDDLLADMDETYSNGGYLFAKPYYILKGTKKN